MPTQPPPDPEILAMRRVVRLVSKLSPAAAVRVLQYALERVRGAEQQPTTGEVK
jgi:hypothetical protein